MLSLSARRGIGKIITARNYVGLITMADGTIIEILPKTLSKTDIRYASVDNVKVNVIFVDLKNADGSISKLLAEVY